MKCLIPILFLFAPIFAIGQTPLGEDNDNTVIDFIDSHIGKKVGKGVCLDLVSAAMKKKGYRRWVKRYDEKKSRLLKHSVDFNSLQPGDIIDMQNVFMKDGRHIEFHIAIVYKINGSVLTIAEQNVGSGGGKKTIWYYGRRIKIYEDSKVVLSEFDVNEKKYGRISYYHF